MFFKQWRMERYMKKQLKLRQKAEAKKKIAVYKHLQELYGFVQHLNKNILPNRRARKSFWARVSKGEALLEKTMELLIKKYKPIEKKKKVTKEEKRPSLQGKPEEIKLGVEEKK